MSKKLLLHACCAPCLSQSYRVVAGQDEWKRVLPDAPDFEVSVFYYNPNIHPRREYELRLNEVKRLCDQWGCLLIEGDYSPRLWFEGAKPFADEPERGERCRFCTGMRLDRLFEEALARGYEIVATTLTISPYKNAALIHEQGKLLAEKYGIEYLEADFKKQNGYQKSIRLSKEYALYRQNYCGCIYSKLERESLLHERS